ncbi:hypothetical protein DTO013E5_6497 [Penicillium roqueforti]|uniref:CENP-C homolog n=1 Tax=Penicillium roqueforti (strain FM164) TaxID=1365484 RepID=W6QNA3_PENRF|nr:uncharacterized protein LCP9604111_7490 [Penicillium roqueforti]CDM35614.1 Cupin, RmlC-type [Penicillium roqueforti FM164]KAF9244056.1 hypothetical protein LCP9604111_7490 [Penicillium roqueforti]KAI1833712.1 hypothetical protein CBS147337_5267 [Penicillium roqueforti]KAI2670313.1 hypothetical protein CBS147355_9362 [Penicillium roqueforti]KAI2672775.1 hypothetical protein LCP963914a_9276 [Penicillium roqueforti]
MARGPGKARDFDYSNVGTKGRRTGISLKEGRRDEHGMEEVDGLFSSPEKSPVQLNGFEEEENNSSAGSEGMSMDEGNAPDPMDFLKGTNGSRTSFPPPPAARSPMKTGLTGSPRRTPALQSTPDPQDILESSSPSDGKGFAGAPEELRQDPSPLSTRSVNVGRSNQRNGTRRKPTTKAQLASESEPAVIHDFSDFSDADGDGDENASAFATVQQDFGGSLDVESDSVAAEKVPDSPGQDQHEHDGNSSTTDTTPPREEPVLASKSTKKVAPNSTKAGKNQAKPPAPRGRPKSERRNVEEDADPRPTKKRNTTKASPPVREPLEPELDRVVEDYANRTGPLKGRSLYILKREIPTDNSATHTRSGRVSVRPLAYWRNERCVFGDGEAAEGHRYPLSTIKEVIRTEEQEPEKKKKGKRSTSHKSKSKKRKDDSSDEDEDVDLWEKEGGVLHGYTLKWDGKTQTSSKEEEVLDIAYAPSGIETREVKDSTFRFAKLLSSSFIGSGVVELPPDGVKKPKNSKKMHMVFYVCHGRVQVDISGVQFSAGKGCVFQVPRGNYYSFANTHQKEARLFFTQGCVPDENENENEDETPQMSQDVGPESEFEADTPTAPVHVPAKKAKGRPKGKQKKIGK